MSLPLREVHKSNQLLFEDDRKSRLTHYVFRYPAKFHPPAVRGIIDRFTEKGERILDPFCGSGTLLIEAAVADRPSIGSDIDPIAAFVSRAKTNYVEVARLKDVSKNILKRISTLERSASSYLEFQFTDISEEEFNRTKESEGLWIPAIPNLFHWFRRYVSIDLARILSSIKETEGSDDDHKTTDFLLLCFASIVRHCSNADPVPVSGLEYTAHMKRLDEKGRLINPFARFKSAVRRGLSAVEEFQRNADRKPEVIVLQHSVTSLSQVIDKKVDVIITSPPYHNAVDYYRRHQLEMYWLGFTKSHEERLSLLPNYIGRPSVPAKHPFLTGESIKGTLAKQWELKIRQVDAGRANSFKHYIVSMRKSIEELSLLLSPGKRLILVVGKSSWKREPIPTDRLMIELAAQEFDHEDSFWYPVKNRYMSYSRHNEASIDEEHVVVLRRNHSK